MQGVVFIFVTENTFTPMYATLAAFPENWPLFIRDYSAGLYDPSTYYLSKVISLVSIESEKAKSSTKPSASSIISIILEQFFNSKQ